jgi:hypothetical protein
LEGHRLSCSFTDKDTIIADRIKQSDALRGVRLDLGFIGFETDKNYSSLTHSHLGFLELVVNRFSSTGEVMSVDPGFQKHEYVENDFIIYKSKETYQISGVSVDAVAKDYQSAAKSSVLETNDAQGHPLKLRQAIHKYLQQNAIPTLFQTIARLRR